MRKLLMLLTCMALAGCSTPRVHPDVTIEEDVLFKRLSLFMAGMAYDNVCNGNTVESHKNLNNPDNVRLLKNHKVLVLRLQYLWHQRQPDQPIENGLPAVYKVAEAYGENADKIIRAEGCESKWAKQAAQYLFLFSKSEPEAVNIGTNEFIIKQGGKVTSSK